MIGKTYKCEICGTETEHPIHWLVIQCNERQLTVFKWTTEIAEAAHSRHYCGEAHAQVYISRWFEANCS